MAHDSAGMGKGKQQDPTVHHLTSASTFRIVKAQRVKSAGSQLGSSGRNISWWLGTSAEGLFQLEEMFGYPWFFSYLLFLTHRRTSVSDIEQAFHAGPGRSCEQSQLRVSFLV
jgi:hypothetical protein